jgi:hypothetical protein
MAKYQARFTCKNASCQQKNDQIVQESDRVVLEARQDDMRRSVICSKCGTANMVTVLPVFP